MKRWSDDYIGDRVKFSGKQVEVLPTLHFSFLLVQDYIIPEITESENV